MKKNLFITLPDEACQEFISFLEGKIAHAKQESQTAAIAFALRMDESQRGSALLAAGAQAAYEDILRTFKQGMGINGKV
jgi:hypothetical protein